MKDKNKIERLLALLNISLEHLKIDKINVSGIALQVHLLSQKTKQYL